MALSLAIKGKIVYNVVVLFFAFGSCNKSKKVTVGVTKEPSDFHEPKFSNEELCLMKKTGILSLIVALVLILSAFVGCSSKKEDFVADFNEKMTAKGLSTINGEMKVESEGKNKTIRSAELENGISVRVEFVNRNNKAQNISLFDDGTNDNWRAYAIALIEMYMGEEYSSDNAIKQLGDFTFPGSVKINNDPRTMISLELEGEDESERVLKISRS